MSRKACVIIIIAVSFVVFANSFRNGFVLDDVFIIQKNKTIRDLANIPEFFSSDYWEGTRYKGESSALYRPLVIISYAVDYAVWKLNPFGYHILNLVLHTLNGLLIFYLALIILGKDIRSALFVSLLFIVHPVHVEAVAGIVGRAEVAAVFFLLVAFMAYALKDNVLKMKHGYAVSLFSFGLALLTKETALILPAIIVLYDLFRLGDLRELKKRIARYAGYIGVVIVYFFVRFLALGTVFSPAGKGFFYGQTTLTRLLTMSRVFVSYIKLLVYPVNLRTDYNDFSFSTSPDLAVVLSVTVLVFIFFLFIRGYRNQKPVFFSLGLFLAGLFPVSNIIPFGAVMAERFLYLPSVGYCLLAGIMVAKGYGTAAGPKRGRREILAILLLVFLGMVTMKYNTRWYSNDTLWNYAVKKSPGNARIHYALGVVQLEKKDYEGAIRAFEKSVQIDPRIPEAYNNLSVCYNSINMHEKAVLASETALKHKPDYYEACINMGNAYKSMGNSDKAIESYGKAIKFAPENADAHYNLGLLYYGRKNHTKAMKSFIKITRMDPTYESAWIGVSAVLIEQENYARAIEELEKAAGFLPDSADIYDRLGLACYYKGEFRKAVVKLKKAIELNPGNAVTLNRLGSAYGNMGMYKEALVEFRKALEINPGYGEARDNYNKLVEIGIK